MVCLLVTVLLATACGDSDSDEAESATRTTGDSPSGVPASIGGIIDGDISGEINVLGYVVIDESGTRFCSVLLESFPPQCGAPLVDLVDLDTTALDLQEERGVRWTDDIVILLGRYRDGTFTVLDVGEPQDPLPGDTSEPQTSDDGDVVESVSVGGEGFEGLKTDGFVFSRVFGDVEDAARGQISDELALGFCGERCV